MWICNRDEFIAVYGAAIQDMAMTLARNFRSTRVAAGQVLSAREWDATQADAMHAAACYHAKSWCQMRNVQ